MAEKSAHRASTHVSRATTLEPTTMAEPGKAVPLLSKKQQADRAAEAAAHQEPASTAPQGTDMASDDVEEVQIVVPDPAISHDEAQDATLLSEDKEMEEALSLALIR
ncbi:hypothetical protein AURDEDRAFT_162836 [Auricularia subglabra TFB-10046 SS5]|nr:hypothetical protein AURDEDRAFT_162836 [Auricularia subglabra TFB-10046 SS5]